MYLGERKETVRAWREKWMPGIGSISVPNGVRVRTVYTYQCEHCGRTTAGQLEKATEPFFCACGKIISLQEFRGGYCDDDRANCVLPVGHPGPCIEPRPEQD